MITQIKIMKSRNNNQKINIHTWFILLNEMLQGYSCHVKIQITAHNVATLLEKLPRAVQTAGVQSQKIFISFQIKAFFILLNQICLKPFHISIFTLFLFHLVIH